MVFPYVDFTSVLQDLRLLVFDFRKSVPGEEFYRISHTERVLHAQNLGKRFTSHWVFRHLSFSLQVGDALVVLGPNGSGKSTLLKTIAALTAPSEGHVTLPDGDPRAILGLSALDQNVYSHLTVAEHLELAVDLRGITPDQNLLTIVGLQDRKDQLATELSSGMRARLKLALAIQSQPQLLLLDEPGAGLDETGRALLDEICEQQRQRGC